MYSMVFPYIVRIKGFEKLTVTIGLIFIVKPHYHEFEGPKKSGVRVKKKKHGK